MANSIEPWRGRTRSWPVTPLTATMERMFRDFDDFFAMTPTLAGMQDLRPALEVQETDNSYLVTFDVPGVKAEDIDIDVSGTTLTIRGERREQSRPSEGRASYREVRFGSFERTITLPNDVDATKVEAECDNGVLTVMVPKTTASQRQKISVKTGSTLLERAKETLEAGAEKAKEAMGMSKKSSAGERQTQA